MTPQFPAIPPRMEAVLLILIVAAAVFDVRYRRIPNWLTVGGAVAGVALNTVIGRPEAGPGFALEGLALGFSLYFVLYVLHAMGAGDVKLMAAVGALTGPANWFGIFIVSAIVGGIMALLMVVIRGRLKATFWNVGYILGELTRGRPAYLDKEELDVKNPKAMGLPHGAVIAIGTIFFLAISPHLTR
jgi:prepilin peptidase CpaA